jgi:cyclin C
MAANYWDSTQAKYWTFTRTELATMRSDMAKLHAPLYAKYPLPDPRHLSIYFQTQFAKLGKRMTFRQQAAATAQIYIKRFYLHVEARKTNPYLILATASYLACKMEESPQHIRLLMQEAVRTWPEVGVQDTSKIGECEFALISTLSSRLILHHPYRALSELQGTLGLTSEESGLAHSIINDSYNTDLALLYPPHVIAIAAIFLAVVLRPAHPAGLQAHSSQAAPAMGTPAMSGSAAQNALSQNALAGFGFRQSPQKMGKLVDWLAESKVDVEAVVDATQEMVSLYECWESYNERACKEAITRIVRDVPK